MTTMRDFAFKHNVTSEEFPLLMNYLIAIRLPRYRSELMSAISDVHVSLEAMKRVTKIIQNIR